MDSIDLHTHTIYSDGTLTPSELIKSAKECGLAAVAITDHDNTGALDEAQTSAINYGIELIKGVEFSTTYKDIEVHILGLLINDKDSKMLTAMENLSNNRNNRNERLLKNLNDHGIMISREDLLLGGVKLITKMHFANAIVRKGYASNQREAYKKYLTSGTSTDVKRINISPEYVIDLILKSGGVPVLAHPFRYKLANDEIEELVKHLKELGIKAIECLYSTNTSEQELFSLDLAKKYNLKISGGTDFHGANKPKIKIGCGLGNLQIPYSILDDLRS